MGTGLRLADSSGNQVTGKAMSPYTGDNYVWNLTKLTIDGDFAVNGTFTFGDAATDNLIINGRVSTVSAAGSAVEIDGDTATYSEGLELRYNMVDWSGTTSTFTTLKGMYLRAESTEANASGDVYGMELYGVANNVNTQSIWGALVYAYVKGSAAKTITNVFALQPEISFDAGSSTNTITDACVVRAKVTGGVMSDYTVLDGYRLTLGDMDGESRKYGNGLLLEDSTGEAGTSTLTTGVNINIGTTTGISIADAFTTGISIAADGTTAIDITSSFTGTTGLLLAGTATDGISITGACTDGIHISGTNTASGIHISGDQVDCILVDGDAAADNVLKVSVDDGITIGTGLNFDRTGTTGIITTAISIDTDGTTGIDIAAGFTGTTGIQIAGTATNAISVTGVTTTGISLSADATTGIHITSGMTPTDAIKIDSAGTTGILVTGAQTSAQIKVEGTAILASGEQAIYVNCAAETVATNGMWVTLKSNVSSGDCSGLRSKVTSTRTGSAGGNPRGVYSQAIVGASGFAATVEGILATADFVAGSGTGVDVSCVSGHFSTGTSVTITNLAVGKFKAQTRGDETISGRDDLVLLQNEAVSGNGRTMNSALRILESSMGGGQKSFDVLIDATGVNTTVHDTDQTDILRFRDSGGTERRIIYDPTNATVLEVGTV